MRLDAQIIPIGRRAAWGVTPFGGGGQRRVPSSTSGFCTLMGLPAA
jgi:hypothetical protein